MPTTYTPQHPLIYASSHTIDSSLSCHIHSEVLDFLVRPRTRGWSHSTLMGCMHPLQCVVCLEVLMLWLLLVRFAIQLRLACVQPKSSVSHCWQRRCERQPCGSIVGGGGQSPGRVARGQRFMCDLLRGFEKGLAGGGWRPTVPKIQQEMPPRIMFSHFIRGHRKKGGRKAVWFYGAGGISLRQPPLPANPFSKLLIFRTQGR